MDVREREEKLAELDQLHSFLLRGRLRAFCERGAIVLGIGCALVFSVIEWARGEDPGPVVFVIRLVGIPLVSGLWDWAWAGARSRDLCRELGIDESDERFPVRRSWWAGRARPSSRT